MPCLSALVNQYKSKVMSVLVSLNAVFFVHLAIFSDSGEWASTYVVKYTQEYSPNIGRLTVPVVGRSESFSPLVRWLHCCTAVTLSQYLLRATCDSWIAPSPHLAPGTRQTKNTVHLLTPDTT